MAQEASIKDIINASLEQIRTIIDANTVLGNQIVTPSGTVIIPDNLMITEIGMYAFSNDEDVLKDENDEIAEEEYNALLEIIRTKPKAADGYNYKFKADLTWELYELPHVDVHDDVTDEEFMRMIEEVL